MQGGWLPIVHPENGRNLVLFYSFLFVFIPVGISTARPSHERSSSDKLHLHCTTTMDVSQQLAEYEASKANDVLERATPIEVDAGLLAAYDTTPVDASEYA